MPNARHLTGFKCLLLTNVNHFLNKHRVVWDTVASWEWWTAVTYSLFITLVFVKPNDDNDSLIQTNELRNVMYVRVFTWNYPLPSIQESASPSASSPSTSPSTTTPSWPGPCITCSHPSGPLCPGPPVPTSGTLPTVTATCPQIPTWRGPTPPPRRPRSSICKCM